MYQKFSLGFAGTCLLLTLTDSLYHGDLTLWKLWTFEDLEWSDWKCTPITYVMHNFLPGLATNVIFSVSFL